MEFQSMADVGSGIADAELVVCLQCVQAYNLLDTGKACTLYSKHCRPVPDCTYDPVFCTWTAKNKNVSAEWVETIAPIAKELGFGTLLLDDGWMDWPESRNSYPFLGSWIPHPRKFPDFAEHVSRIQKLGMKYMLWVAPFRMGMESELADSFMEFGWHRQKEDPDRRSIYLDPRYPKVEQYVRNTLTRLMLDYGLNGLKIDFVDGVGSKIESHMDVEVMSIPFGQHWNQLMHVLMKSLKLQCPDLMIESRQKYANLANYSWTNCYRSPDVPLNFHRNRYNCAVLRMLYPDRAVYFDPALWSIHESDENVARHLISALIAVPMISVELDIYPDTQLSLIRHWMSFYSEHKETFVRGRFQPGFRLGHLPEAMFIGNEETIVALYDDHIFKLENFKGALYILNGTSRSFIEVLKADVVEELVVEVFDAVGQCLFKESRNVLPSQVNVPIGGYIRLK